MSDREVVVLSAVRTAIGKFGGALKDIPPSELAAKGCLPEHAAFWAISIRFRARRVWQCYPH
jgi:hypothetical protein